MGQLLPEECCTPGEADDCAIIVSLTAKTIGKAHNFLVSSSGVCGNYRLSSSKVANL